MMAFDRTFGRARLLALYPLLAAMPAGLSPPSSSPVSSSGEQRPSMVSTVRNRRVTARGGVRLFHRVLRRLQLLLPACPRPDRIFRTRSGLAIRTRPRRSASGWRASGSPSATCIEQRRQGRRPGDGDAVLAGSAGRGRDGASPRRRALGRQIRDREVGGARRLDVLGRSARLGPITRARSACAVCGSPPRRQTRSPRSDAHSLWGTWRRWAAALRRRSPVPADERRTQPARTCRGRSPRWCRN